MMNRRELLRNAAALAAAGSLRLHALMLPGNDAPVSTATLASDPRRPQFHLLPARNWMNDPNGPIYWKGQYHMFYQYNPHAAVWGDMHWAHAISPDTIHWKHLPIALAPTPGGPDAAGCFSGTAIVDNGVVSVVYTGVVQAPADQATVRDGVNSFREMQCLATSNDPELKTWTKLPQPVIAAPPEGIKVSGFRDPSPWRKGDSFYMTVGSGVRNQGGLVLLYRSNDLRHWDYLHPVASGTGAGAGAVNPVDTGDMWECPDLFPLDGKHVLIYSARGKVFWQTGVLDEQTMLFHPEKFGITDHGAFYAAKTQVDAHGQRMLWGWITETRPVEEYRAAGWAGMMSLPRMLRLHSDGELGVDFSPQIAMLRGREQSISHPSSGADVQKRLAGMFIENASGELLLSLTRGSQPFVLSLTGSLPSGDVPIAQISFDPASPQQVVIGDKTVPVSGAASEPLEIHALIDGSVAEIVVNRRAAFTQRFYYPGRSAPRVGVKLEGNEMGFQSLQLWQIHPISPNRLTTPA